MTPEAVSSGGGGAPTTLGRLPTGALLSDRFTVEKFLGAGLLGEHYQAADATDGKQVLVKLLSRNFVRNPKAKTRLAEDVALATRLAHKNIAVCHGFFAEGENLYIIAEPSDGTTLRQMLERKLKEGRAFTLKGAYNVITHLCNALEHAHGGVVHGLLNADTIVVNLAGRVKIGDFGVARALAPEERFRASLGPANAVCMAPEMSVSPDTADRRADIYSTGALFFELLTGRPIHAGSDGARVSIESFVTGLPPSVDAIIERCLAPLPADRFTEIGDLKRALHAACEGVLVAASAPPIPSAAAPQRPKTPAFGVPVPSPPLGVSVRPPAALLSPPLLHPLPAPPRALAASSADQRLTVDEGRERWLVQKDKLDLGPFRLSDVKQQIIAGQIMGDHIIIDMENGERRRIREHPLLTELASHADDRHASDRLTADAAQAARAHRHRLFAIVAGIAVLLLVGAGGLTAYVLTHRPPAEEHTKIVYREHESDDPLKGIEFSMKPDPPSRPVKGRHPTAHGPGLKNPTGEFDSVTNIGDATAPGGDETLPREVVQKVMAGNFKSLTGCILEEKHRDSALRNVDLDFVIRGSGQVSAVKVNGATNTPFAGCMLGKMQTVPFPHFNGVKTVASFSLALK